MFNPLARHRILVRVAAFTSLAVCLFIFLQSSARAQSAAVSPDIVISQIYSRGGESGATYRSDFVELFNRGAASVDVSGWTVEVRGLEGRPGSTTAFSFASNNSVILPGKHFLFEFARGTEGQEILLADFPAFGFSPNLNGAGAYVALYRGSHTVSFGSCPSGSDLVDLVGYGTAACREGFASAPAPSATQALVRRGGGCTDTDDNSADFQTAAPTPRNSFFNAAAPCGGVEPFEVRLSKSVYEASEADDHVTVTVMRTGDTSGAASVEYLTQTGTVDARRDYTPVSGTLDFAPGESSKTVDVLLTDDGYVEGDESVHFDLIGSDGVSLGSPRFGTILIHDNDATPAGVNPVEDSTFFVRQHYHDFLNRAPDDQGLAFWTNNIESCGAGAEAAQCREVRRVNTSAAFFLSIEFQQTGFLAYRAHRATAASFMQMGMPVMQVLQRDQRFIGRGVVVGRTGWQQVLEANTRAYFEEFVTRSGFRQRYDSMSNAQYVDALNANAGGALTKAERDALAGGLNGGTETRASVLRKVSENGAFADTERNRAFVLMQYFGYMRRDPNEPPEPGLNFDGYNFWLGKLDEFHGNFVAAEMVKAFITSDEYRARFAAQ